MGERVESLQKNSLYPNAASHNVSWYADTYEFLEHSRSVGSLYYRDNSGFLGPPSYKCPLHSKDLVPLLVVL